MNQIGYLKSNRAERQWDTPVIIASWEPSAYCAPGPVLGGLDQVVYARWPSVRSKPLPGVCGMRTETQTCRSWDPTARSGTGKGAGAFFWVHKTGTERVALKH